MAAHGSARQAAQQGWPSAHWQVAVHAVGGGRQLMVAGSASFSRRVAAGSWTVVARRANRFRTQDSGRPLTLAMPGETARWPLAHVWMANSALSAPIWE